MAILPGSLDYLYYNGILDHIPYEAYEQTPITPSGMAQMSGMGMNYTANPMMHGYGTAPMPAMNGTQYLQSAQKGLLYNTYTYPDTFVRRNNNDIEIGADADFKKMAYGEEGKNFRQAISDAAVKTKETVSSSPNWIKGLLASGILITTLCMLFKRGKKA
ncbi:hypothetical protein IJ384_03945 [bacterium]|nr:hypothetical protein [bacterium]